MKIVTIIALKNQGPTDTTTKSATKPLGYCTINKSPPQQQHKKYPRYLPSQTRSGHTG
jgi:hypothetical protein